MSIYLHSTGEMKTTVNGDIIQDAAFNATYDGEQMKITGHENDKNFNKQLNNNDIMELIAKRSHHMPLNQRLIKDFGMKNNECSFSNTKKVQEHKKSKSTKKDKKTKRDKKTKKDKRHNKSKKTKKNKGNKRSN